MCNVDRLHELLLYDPVTGAFIWRVQRCGKAMAGYHAGTASHGYRTITVDSKKFGAHRLAWAMYYGTWPTGEVDHINGDRSDNRISNLRDVSRKVNQQNRRHASRRAASGLLGASLHKASGLWRASISLNGRAKTIGYFSSAGEAHTAYLEAKRQLHPGCTL